MSPPSPGLRPAGYDVIVIGGGCAGFSAATALVDRGAHVLVVEARPGLGGRATAFRDPGTGERVDNGQHILMGCYVETLRLLDRIGAAPVVVDEIVEVDVSKPVTEPKAEKPAAKKATKGKAKAEPEAADA